MVRTDSFYDGLIASLFLLYDDSISSASEREQSLVELYYHIFADLNFFVVLIIRCMSSLTSLTCVHSRLSRAIDEVRW
jgi:hypothetical protein